MTVTALASTLASASPLEPSSITAIINYYCEPPALSSNFSGLSPQELRKLRRRENVPDILPTLVRIYNTRTSSTPFTLSSHGFTVASLHSCLDAYDWEDEATLKAVYFPEVTELLQRLTGAEHVFQYEHHIRRRTLSQALEEEDSRPKDVDEGVDINGPVRRLHIDETPVSARREFEYWIGDSHPELKGRPFGIYNVWKPLKTVQRDPLCVCDARTLREEDLRVGAVRVPVVGEIENYSIRKPRDGGKDDTEGDGRHKFWYVARQKSEEALIFRIFDSRFEGKNFGVAHTSFEEPGTEANEARESVEVRSFCVF